MAVELNLSTIVSGYDVANVMNVNNALIIAAFQDCISRSGGVPNQMAGDLDMDGGTLLNISNFADLGVQVNWNHRGSWITSTAYLVNDVIFEDGSSYVCLEVHTAGTFVTDLAALKWQIVAQQGGTGAGTGDMLGASNLSDLVDASASRTNLGVVIGTDVQAHTAVLDATTASFVIADETKLDGIEALADVTDETNVIEALKTATLSTVTLNSDDKFLIRDSSDGDNIKRVTTTDILSSVDFAMFGGAPHAVYEDVRSTGVHGGTFTSGDWRTRTINTEKKNSLGWATRSGNKVKFDYDGWVEWEATAVDVDSHVTRLFNDDTSTGVTRGTAEYDDNGSTRKSTGGGKVNAGVWYKIQHRCSFTRTSVGLGRAGGFGSEVYLRLKYWRS